MSESKFYSLSVPCYNYICLGRGLFLAQTAVFLFLDNIIQRHYLNKSRACAVERLRSAFGLDIQSTGAVFAFGANDCTQTERPTFMLGGVSGPLERSAILMCSTDDVILNQSNSPVNPPTKNEVEIWKAIPGFPGYEVSTLGRVRSYRKKGRGKTTETPQRILNPSSTPSGYLGVSLHTGDRFRHVKVASLVALVFLGERPKGMQICHNDGNPKNNQVDNLRYDTPKANIQDRKKHGTYFTGEKCPNAVLMNVQAREIRYKRAEGHSTRQLASEYNVSISVIRDVVRGRTYKEAGGPTIKHRKRVTKEDVPIIKKRRQNGESLASIARSYDVSNSYICKILKGIYLLSRGGDNE